MKWSLARRVSRAGVAFFLATCAVAGGAGSKAIAGDARGWGLDAVLSVRTDAEDRRAYLSLLRDTGIDVLRDRQPRPEMAELKAQGHRVIAFVQLPALPLMQPGNALSEDLLAVYAAAREMAREHAEYVDAWEMVGEPDVGFCRDLPDRVAAYQKAVYLGIKAGVGNAVPVLMGALALPPGPWLERARRNGLLDYTDAYNFHYYSDAAGLSDTIRAHAVVAERDASGAAGAMPGFQKSPLLWRRTAGTTRLPLWITECGFKAVTRDTWLDPARRELQAAFTRETARQALESNRVAVFTPFIFAHDGDPFAMTLPGAKPLPAWDAYVAFTREHPWPQREWSRPPPAPDPVVVQWLPDNHTTVPHKVSGTYRFWRDEPLRGEFRIYNFSDHAIHGRWRMRAPSSLGTTFPAVRELDLAPGTVTTLPGEFKRDRAGYFQAWVQGEFRDDHGEESGAWFGLETPPIAADFSEEPLPLRPLPGGKIAYPINVDYHLTSQGDTWTGVNGVTVSSGSATNLAFTVTDPHASENSDPLYLPMAVAAVNGLPAHGFLVIKWGELPHAGHQVRVDLVDDAGQRFSIWENLGRSYYEPRATETWLNVDDFGLFFWGHCSLYPKLHPGRVREVQLRFYSSQPAERFTFDLVWRRPR